MEPVTHDLSVLQTLAHHPATPLVPQDRAALACAADAFRRAGLWNQARSRRSACATRCCGVRMT